MQPIYLTSADQQRCLSKLTASKTRKSKTANPRYSFSASKANWTGNFNYWTGGYQSCKGLWGWCDGASQFQPMAAALLWAANQPDLVRNAQNCLQMRVDRNGSGVVLNGRECKERYVYACQVQNFT
jgi:hypothetical protein